MLNSSHGKKPTMSLQEMISLFSNQFFLLIYQTLVLGISGAIGTFSCLVYHFSLIYFLTSLWFLFLALNSLTLLLLRKRAMKQQPLPKISNYTFEQIINILMRATGLLSCPLLLPIVALLQVRKGLW
jgi:hypothetical protein